MKMCYRKSYRKPPSAQVAMRMATRAGATGWGLGFEAIVSSIIGMAKFVGVHEDGRMATSVLSQIGYSCSCLTRSISQMFRSEWHKVGAGKSS